MDQELIKKKIFEFLDNYELAVMSTIHSDKDAPESAVVGFGNNESLELVFGTSNNSRKYINLQKNPNVSFVIGWSSETGSVQYEGLAQELTQDKVKLYSHLLIKKNEDHKKFLAMSDRRYFLVKPLWIRFNDYEITF